MTVGVGEDAGRGERQAWLELDDDQNGELDIGRGFEVEGIWPLGSDYDQNTQSMILQGSLPDDINIKYNLFIFSEHYYIRKT